LKLSFEAPRSSIWELTETSLTGEVTYASAIDRAIVLLNKLSLQLALEKQEKLTKAGRSVLLDDRPSPVQEVYTFQESEILEAVLQETEDGKILEERMRFTEFLRRNYNLLLHANKVRLYTFIYNEDENLVFVLRHTLDDLQ
jgi:hypothetical protein